MKNKVFKHRKSLASASLLVFVLGLVMAYSFKNEEPLETVGGFLSGFGISLSLCLFH